VEPDSPWQKGDAEGPLQLHRFEKELSEPRIVQTLSNKFVQLVGGVVEPDPTFPRQIRRVKTCLEMYQRCSCNIDALVAGVAGHLTYALRMTVAPLGGNKVLCPIFSFEADLVLTYVQVCSFRHGPFTAELLLASQPGRGTPPPFQLRFPLHDSGACDLQSEAEVFVRLAEQSAGPWEICLLEYEEDAMDIVTVIASNKIDLDEARRRQRANLVTKKALKAMRAALAGWKNRAKTKTHPGRKPCVVSRIPSEVMFKAKKPAAAPPLDPGAPDGPPDLDGDADPEDIGAEEEEALDDVSSGGESDNVEALEEWKDVTEGEEKYKKKAEVKPKESAFKIPSGVQVDVRGYIKVPGVERAIGRLAFQRVEEKTASCDVQCKYAGHRACHKWITMSKVESTDCLLRWVVAAAHFGSKPESGKAHVAAFQQIVFGGKLPV
jgi:hypothetical protein